MKRIRSLVHAYAADEGGATAIEYGLIVGLVTMTIIVWAVQIGVSVRGFFEKVQAGFSL